jgi:hypothetical protein
MIENWRTTVSSYATAKGLLSLIVVPTSLELVSNAVRALERARPRTPGN